MKGRFLLVLILLPVLVRPAPAGIIFGKKGKKPTPKERVPELLVQVKTDGDEDKRAHAAQELRQYDPAAFPEIVPVLMDVLLTDKKPAVRAEAAQSLGRLRPVSQQAGLALEQALAKDPSMRVRLQARTSLLQYHWAGYHGSKKDDTPFIQSKEPPLADQEKVPPTVNTSSVPGTPGPAPEPRLQPQPAPVLVPAPVSNPGAWNPLATQPVPAAGPPPAPPATAQPPGPRAAGRQEPPPAAPANTEGPQLMPPE